MEELIKITENNGQSVVSARELHGFLESKREFSTWIKQRIQKFGFIENEDYATFDNFVIREKENSDCLTNLSSKGRGGHNRIEYALTIDMAKELSMVEANDKGRQARRFFIERDKQLSKIQSRIPYCIEDVAKEIIRQMKEEGEILQLNSSKPKVNYFSVSEYIREYLCLPLLIDRHDILSISNDAKRMCRINNIEVKSVHSHIWESGINTYPENILKTALNNFIDEYRSF